MQYPDSIVGLIGGSHAAKHGTPLPKYSPSTGERIASTYEATFDDVEQAVARGMTSMWRQTPLQERVRILLSVVERMEQTAETYAPLLALETGRSKKSALGEIMSAAACGRYLADNASYLSPTSLTSYIPRRQLSLHRHPLGLGLLITPFNNPYAGIAWKLFPSLLAGNSVLIKAHELTPYTPHLVAKLFLEAGVPNDALSVIEGGRLVGERLVKDSRFRFISFTGSNLVGASILAATAQRLTRVSIESGGKNPFVVCDDAHIAYAAETAVRSSFIDAGQRCAAASRILVFDDVYDEFREVFLMKVASLSVGVQDTDDYGAVISQHRIDAIMQDISAAKSEGATVLHGGTPLKRSGYFVAPTVFEHSEHRGVLAHKEIFGPVVALYRVNDLRHAIAVANDTPYLLSSAIHTQDMSRANAFIAEYLGGVVRVNGATYGSEPHVPFGGEGLSGNGWREPGLPALDFYTNLKQVSFDHHD